MTEQRKGLDLSKLHLQASKPDPKREGQGGLVTQTASKPWPSREAPPREVQINIRVPEDVLGQFKEIAYRERITHAKALALLVDFYLKDVR